MADAPSDYSISTSNGMTVLTNVGESYIIDVRHWRHSCLIMGMVWGLLVAGRSARGAAAVPGRPAAYGARPVPG